MVRLRGPLAGAMVTVVLVACEDRSIVPVDVASVEISPSSFTLVEGEGRTAEAIPRGPDGVVLAGRSVTWTTDAPGVATVDGTGTLEGVLAGQTTVRATVEGVTGSAPVTVLPGPSITLSRTAVSLGAVSGQRSGTEVIRVTNGGAGVLAGLSARIEYAAAGPSGWLTAGLNGTTAPTDLSISASAESLDPGSYQATVILETMTGGGLSAQVDVALAVEAPPPLIVLSIGGDPAEEVAFVAVEGGQVPATQVVAVTNGGGGTLGGLFASTVYADGEPAGWLRADLAVAVAPTELTLRASPGALSPGTYHATVEVGSAEASNSPRALPVVFTVAPAGGPSRRTATSLASVTEGAGGSRGGRRVQDRLR